MDEFNTPLGLDRDKPNQPAKFSVMRIMSGASLLLLASTAIWFYIPKEKIIAPASVPAGKSESGIVTPKPPAAPLRKTTQKESRTYTQSPPDKPGRLEELVPTGSLSEPKITYLNNGSSSGPSALIERPNLALIEQSNVGPLPKISKSGLRPMDVYARKIAPTASIRIAIIVGGLGLSQSGTKSAIEQLPADVTLAFAPYGNSINRWMRKARRDGHELLMQIPMEPIGYPQINPGKHTLVSSVSPDENIKNLHWSMGRMTNYVGMMNYLGAKISADAEALLPPLEEIAKRGLLYIDDGSAFSSKTKPVAKQLSLPFAQGNIIIDDGRTSRIIEKNLAALEKLARRNGKAIGIASAFPMSVRQISAWIKSVRKRGIEIVPISALVR